jgi:hypothetical protein
MARRSQRRYSAGRRSASHTRPDDSEHESRVNFAAQLLASRYTLDELRSQLSDRVTLFEQADQVGTSDPSPANLARYRSARMEWEVARRAVALASVSADD